MKIESITLKNFALIKSGMGLNEITLDFTKAKYRITLILGNNGTGKTALLSNLHPYAYLGNLENRDDLDLIIPGLDGYKKIVIRNKTDKYEIEHRYFWNQNKSRTINSYIMKNGYELNSNGNVSTFKKIITKEFDIDMNYLKLIRLGNNVNNFVDMKASDRKVFIGKILEEIEPYTFDNKLISNRAGDLKAILKIAIDRKNKLDIDNIENVNERLEKYENIKKEKQIELEKLYQDFYVFDGKVNKEGFGEYDEGNLKLVEKSINRLNEKINNLVKPKNVYINTMEKTVIDKYNKFLDDWTNEKTELVKKLAVLEINISKYKEELEKAKNIKDSCISSVEIKSIEDRITSLKLKINSINNIYNFKQKVPSFTKEELSLDLEKIKEITFNIKQCNQYSKISMSIFKDLMEDNYNDLTTVYKLIKDEYDNTYNDLVVLTNKTNTYKKYVLFIPKECVCHTKCPYYNFVNKSKNESSQKDKIRSIETYLENLNEVKCIIEYVFDTYKILNSRGESKFDKYYQLTNEKFLKAIYTSNINNFIDVEKINQLMSLITYYDEYKDYQNKLNDLTMELELKTSKNNNVSKDEIEYQIEAYNKSLNCANKEKNYLKEKIEETETRIKSIKIQISDYNTFMTYNYYKKDLDNKLKEAKMKYDYLKNGIKVKNEYVEKRKDFNNKIIECKNTITDIEDEIQKLKTKKDNFIELNNEIKYIEKEYDKVKYIKEATSSTNGIPLLYIKKYCTKLCDVANRIIRKIYNGELELLDFKIDKDSFKIPYKVKDVEVKDIKDASQAEVSIIKIAISFAILASYMTKYNIILLDEIDGPLHKENKIKLINNLDYILDIISSDQAFIITQSTMFNHSAANLIITDPEYTFKYSINKNNDEVVFAK